VSAAPGVDADNLEAEALWWLEQYALRYGVALVKDVVDVLDGKSTDMLVEGLSSLVGDLVRPILRVIEADVARAALEASFAAANAAGDAALAAKFGQ
jgi:hypothetical protein